MDNKYEYHSAHVIMQLFDVDVATARKIKAGEIDPADLQAKPQPKKHKDKKEIPEDNEVTNG